MLMESIVTFLNWFPYHFDKCYISLNDDINDLRWDKLNQ